MKYKKIATMVLMCLMCTAVQAGGAICPAANSFCTPDITQNTPKGGDVPEGTKRYLILDDGERIVIPESFVDIKRNNERNNTIFHPPEHNAALLLPKKPHTSMHSDSDSDSEADEPDYLALGGDIT